MTTTPLFKSYRRALKQFETRHAKLKASAAKMAAKATAISAKADRLTYPHYIDKLIRPIGQAMLSKMPTREMEILGPFGLSCEVAIHFYKKGVPENRRLVGDNCRSITFVHASENGIALRDHTHNSGVYSPNSIGAVNGMNYRTVQIPANADTRFFLRWMRKQESAA